MASQGIATGCGAWDQEGVDADVELRVMGLKDDEDDENDLVGDGSFSAMVDEVGFGIEGAVLWFVLVVDAVEERVVRLVGDSMGGGKSLGWLRVPTMIL